MLRCNKRSVATGGEGTPVLVDFGLAKALVFESGGNGDPAPAPTAAAAATAAPRPLFRMTPRTGSQRYMAPEVGGGASTARARHSTPKHMHPTPLSPAAQTSGHRLTNVAWSALPWLAAQVALDDAEYSTAADIFSLSLLVWEARRSFSRRSISIRSTSIDLSIELHRPIQTIAHAALAWRVRPTCSLAVPSALSTTDSTV
jgi:serine/threonine protein kinase